MDKKDVVYKYGEILLSYQKVEFLPSATTWMDHQGIMPNEISQMKQD